MKPTFLILYIVVITLLLTLVFPRLRRANPTHGWVALLAGIALLGVGVLVLILLS